MLKLFKVLAILIFLNGAAAYGQGIVFKIPDNVFPMDWKKSSFKGILMLQKDSPSGAFISSPNDGETIEQLRERAAKFIVPMVVSETKDLKHIPFEIRPISKNKGDRSCGQYYLYKGEKSSAQILFYEREANGTTFLYGYFASKENDDKKSSLWADVDGKGVKLFEKFVRSFRD